MRDRVRRLGPRFGVEQRVVFAQVRAADTLREQIDLTCAETLAGETVENLGAQAAILLELVFLKARSLRTKALPLPCAPREAMGKDDTSRDNVSQARLSLLTLSYLLEDRMQDLLDVLATENAGREPKVVLGETEVSS